MRILKRNSLILAIILSGILSACNGGLSDKFHMEKRYWDLSDYNEAVNQIKYFTKEDEQYPNYSNPETSPVFKKIVSIENVSVVLKDEALGLSHKNKFAEGMFKLQQDLFKTYNKIDRQDKFVYPVELVDIEDFGMKVQPLYFQLGNDQIVKNATDPESAEVKRMVNGNVQTMVGNFVNNINFIRHEEALNEEAKKRYAETIKDNITKLISDYPDANYTSMLSAVKTIQKRIKDAEIKKSFDHIQELITANIEQKEKKTQE